MISDDEIDGGKPSSIVDRSCLLLCQFHHQTGSIHHNDKVCAYYVRSASGRGKLKIGQRMLSIMLKVENWGKSDYLPPATHTRVKCIILHVLSAPFALRTLHLAHECSPCSIPSFQCERTILILLYNRGTQMSQLHDTQTQPFDAKCNHKMQ